MFAIRIKNQYLDLNPKTAISIRMNNPIFDADNFPRTWTLPFSVPLTPRNLAVLGYPNLINFAGKKKIENATLYIEGLPFETGTFTITNASDKFIKATFQNIDLTFLKNLDKIKINKILETIAIPQNTAAQTKLSAANPPATYSLNVNNVNFSLDGTSGYSDPAEVAGYFSIQINQVFSNLTTVETPDRLIFNPQNGEELQIQIFQGWTVFSNNAPALANQSNMTDYITDSHTNGNTKIAFPTYYNDAQYENGNPAFEGYINYYENGQLKQNTPQTTEQFEHTVVPFVRIPYIFEQIVANSDIKAISGDFYNLADTQQLVIYNNYALDQISEYFDVSTSAIRFLNGFKASIDLNQHIPDISAKDALKLLDFANVYYEIKGETLYIRNKINQLLQPAISWTKKAEPGYNIEYEDREGFSLEYPTDDTDIAKRANQLTPITIGEGVEPITLPIGTIYEDMRSIFLNPDSFTWSVPIIQQKGSSDELKIGMNETGIKLLFDRGLQNNSRGNTYPFGTHKSTNYEGNSVGTYTLDWSGINGIYEKFWKQYLPLLQGDTITKKIRLEIADILEVRKWENSRRTIRHPNGHLSGVIKTISFKIDQTGISAATVEFIKE